MSVSFCCGLCRDEVSTVCASVLWLLAARRTSQVSVLVHFFLVNCSCSLLFLFASFLVRIVRTPLTSRAATTFRSESASGDAAAAASNETTTRTQRPATVCVCAAGSAGVLGESGRCGFVNAVMLFVVFCLRDYMFMLVIITPEFVRTLATHRILFSTFVTKPKSEESGFARRSLT